MNRYKVTFYIDADFGVQGEHVPVKAILEGQRIMAEHIVNVFQNEIRYTPPCVTIEPSDRTLGDCLVSKPRTLTSQPQQPSTSQMGSNTPVDT